MSKEELVKALMTCRGYMTMHTNGLTDEQLTTVPEGLENNILWNLGHLYHSHCGMTYGNSGLESPSPENYGDLFKGGTKPSDWAEAPSIEEVTGNFNGIMDKIVGDYTAGIFDNFKPTELGPGMTLDSIEDALGFVLIHESVHHGNIITMRRLLGVS
ncbi:MAG TPA: DinB family protein [Nitrospirales bacterium]|nr:DinB family protein [Nitrospirales bacterium]